MPAEDGTTALDVSKSNGAVGAVEGSSAVRSGGNDAPKVEPPEADEFGLPVKPPRRRQWDDEEEGEEQQKVNGVDDDKDDSDAFEDAPETPAGQAEDKSVAEVQKPRIPPEQSPSTNESKIEEVEMADVEETPSETNEAAKREAETKGADEQKAEETPGKQATDDSQQGDAKKERRNSSRPSSSHSGGRPHAQSIGASEWSHQQLAPQAVIEEEDDDDGGGEWQEMPALATHRIYDDWGKVLAKEYGEVDDEHMAYGNLGGAGKGYTRVQVDDDAQSATSLDDNTAYLFKDAQPSNALDDDEEGRDLLSQMQTTKELLTEGQRIAYVGVVRLSIGKMLGEITELEKTKGTKKAIDFATEGMKMWGQKMMVRMYGHMDIDSAEQVMVEQLAEHGVFPSDLTPALMQNARVKNPAKQESDASSNNSAPPSLSSPRPSTSNHRHQSSQNLSAPQTPQPPATPPPTYEEHTASELTIQNPEDLERAKDLDIDIRWTILCDLFLLLIADSTYDARSRTLLEYVGFFLSVPWQEICRFEKRVTDALEMQEQADKENWNEDEHLESRKKAAKRKRLMVMGLCTVGGGLVIGLSAGLLAPVIGAGLAAGFTTIGVAGTSTILGGTGAAALIGTAGTLTGSVIAVRASNRRTGAVKTFEYKPLFNNKRTNLIVTVSGWMTGKVDDVRLPFSNIDPIMGDIYSINWEPEMLQSTGQTVQILATEALTQTIQQILGSTILTALMAGLSVPIVLTKLSYLIDNPWTVSLVRADATGLILADSLIDRNLGIRPVTLVGFSLGSRVIFSCLKELARRGALGLVQDVYLFGSPIVAKRDEYLRARSVVSGRFVNGYATNDWILGYLFRATSGGLMRISGLASVDGVKGVENKDVTELVPGHMAYRANMPKLLEECGWLVDGLEFSEIEDADPENHEKRQRELIDEIEAARFVLEEKGEVGKKSRFKSLFSRKKAPVKRDWETYDERSQQKVLEGADPNEAERMAAESENIMFDVDAIRAEALKLALQGEDLDEIKKHLQVKEIESTMPALKVTSTNVPSEADAVPRESLRQTKSYQGPSMESKAESSQAPTMANGHASSYEEPSQLSPPLVDERPSTSPGPSTGQSTPDKASQPERPPLRSIVTAPAPQLTDPTLNPWSDEDDPTFGREGAVQMSFE